MLGKPGGTLARTYDWHIEALNNDMLNRFKVECIHEMNGNIDINKYDIFWFYAKAFQPTLYHEIKKLRNDAKIICGPNILLDKPDIGLSDDWDNWYVNHCRPNIHLDQVSFYSNHVKKYLSKETKKVAKILDKCMKIEDVYYKSKNKKEYDCLIYSKKRRYDYGFENFRNELVNLLKDNGITYYEIKAGKYGKYEREDYFDALNKSKVMVNLSLDECPGILNYESMFCNVPVIGSEHNLPITSCKQLIVENTDKMTDNYLVRESKAAEFYFDKIVMFLQNKIDINIDHRSWIIDYTSYKAYSNKVHDLIKEI